MSRRKNRVKKAAMPLAMSAVLACGACVNTGDTVSANAAGASAASHDGECYVPRLQAEAEELGLTEEFPCSPCGPGAILELEMDEAQAAYDCIKGELVAAYAVSGLAISEDYVDWTNYSAAPYLSALHGSRYVNNYADGTAASYGEWEDGGDMVEGGILAKDSMTISTTGRVGVGPLFLMEKMAAGWNPDSDDWKYSMVTANGAIFGETKGTNAGAMTFCVDCHLAAERDHMFFLPEELRVNGS